MRRREADEERQVPRLVAKQSAPRFDVLFVVVELPQIFGRLRLGDGSVGLTGRRQRRCERARPEEDQQQQADSDAAPHRRSGHFDPSGTRNCLAIRRAAFLTARVELVTVIVAVETASMSLPTLKRSRMFLRTNCAANSGVSTEK